MLFQFPSQTNLAYRESNIYQEPTQVLSRENDLYGSYPTRNQYIDPDNLSIPSNIYMDPDAQKLSSYSIQVKESKGLEKANKSQNQYANFKGKNF